MSRVRNLLVRSVACTAAVAVLAGCAGTEGSARAGAEASRPAAGAPTHELPVSPTASPSLPPGDPGLDAPGVPSPDTSDPGKQTAEGHHGHGHGHGHGDGEPRAEIPDGALVGADLVAATLGGTWATEEADAVRCTVPALSAGRRTVSYRSTEAEVVQTVSTHEDGDSADAAVAAVADRLVGCGWRLDPDPRLGTASVAAGDGARRVTVVSAEGVSVVLVGSGRAAGDDLAWSSLVDVALGTSCAAAADGCH
jgi:hypothetical protein